ncbi:MULTISPECIES: hypothetical protein [Paenibacillus]|uniref:Knr4/Smi1-like domain-containing protein n=1 Tax=Paenibacillus borealis TaxID=160799 RepID=A0ABX3HCX6_PAEBO|nr:hypothetical protein [Paenibacillus borealis]OMD48343.1 hypothetical protein BSK56_11205 [Paenibacillus borealis]
MDEKVKYINELSIIKKVKEKLVAEPDSIIFGELNEGNTGIKSNDDCIKQYFEFLKESDGARCGAVDLWSFDEFPSHQSRVSDFLGGIENWIEVGQVLYEPLVIDKNSGQVYCFCQGHPARVGQTLGDFHYFLLNYVFGGKYEELIPDAHLDDWYQFLKRIGLA